MKTTKKIATSVVLSLGLLALAGCSDEVKQLNPTEVVEAQATKEAEERTIQQIQKVTGWSQEESSKAFQLMNSTGEEAFEGKTGDLSAEIQYYLKAVEFFGEDYPFLNDV